MYSSLLDTQVLDYGTLSHADWLAQAQEHRNCLSPFVDRFIFWRTHGHKHPVYDFLFSYYSFSSGQLLRWSPGFDVILLAADESELEWPDHFRRTGSGFSISSACFPSKRIPYLRWAIRFLEATLQRAPIFHCFGIHEWAMLYKIDDTRHPEVPLRLPASELEALVEANPIRCSHYDAFRFFSPQAKQRNKTQLARDAVEEQDQPGCIHANMDLYRMAYKVAPFISSKLLSEVFLLARHAREIDMRASPYDLRAFEMSPIQIETREGREVYASEQRNLYETAQPLREKLLTFYRDLLAAAELRTAELKTVELTTVESRPNESDHSEKMKFSN